MPGQVMRGAIPSSPEEIAAAVRFRPAIGGPLTFITKPQQISMWGNDVNGDCVTAEEAFAKACNNPEIFISDAEVIGWATKNNVLNGASLPGVMAIMQTAGFAGDNVMYDDGPYSTVDYTDAATLQSAICLGPVKIGIAADQMEAAYWANGGKTGWVGTGFVKNADAEDHCVSLCGYGTLSWLAGQLGTQLPAGVNGAAAGYAMFTWDSIGIIDEPSLLAITFEAWLRQPTTVVKPNLIDVTSVASAALPGDIAQIFVTLADESISTCWKESDAPGAAWTAWSTFPGQAKAMASATVGDGTAQLFAVGSNNDLYTCWKESTAPGAAWNAWQAMAGAPANAVSVASAALPGGIAQIFVTTTDESISTCWKESNAPGAAWSPWETFQGQAKSIASATVGDGTAQLFAVGSNNGLYTCWKESTAPGAAWNAWQGFVA
jgi:hypothetical protein